MSVAWSAIETAYLSDPQNERLFPASEQIATIVVHNFPNLGMLTALRFLEWVTEHPEGVVSLPTGKTPEYFIHWVEVFLSEWKSRRVQELLTKYGIKRAMPPSLAALHFVQIDEFYPIDTVQKNSFYYYVQKYYIQKFGLDRKRALLINPNEIGLKPGEKLEEVWPGYRVDLSLRKRGPRSTIEERQQQVLSAVDQFCNNYEGRIRELGGIGFFLGGIGPDGHIGFNVRGSTHYSTTRLCATNYETQAAAATDLGGIEIARTRLVITIGLSTITYNPQCTSIIIAAGEAKARIVSSAICDPTQISVPASALRSLSNARFYITKGAAVHLEERNYLRRKKDPAQLRRDEARIITELARIRKKRLADLTTKDFTHTQSAALLAETKKNAPLELVAELERTYRQRILDALQLPSEQVFLHTAPHHDDIMLGFIPYLARLIRNQSNTHYFNYLTSGFTSVTNGNLLTHIELAERLIAERNIFNLLAQKNYFDYQNTTHQDNDVLEHLDGVAAHNRVQANLGTARRFLRNLNQLYGDHTNVAFTSRLQELRSYLQRAYPGMKDEPEVQQLKGMIREWEADLLWGFFGFNSQSVIHSRLGFYKGEIFTEPPQYERDIKPIITTLTKVQPTVISVALDPEGSGPDTHYKVLQAITAALKQYQKESRRDDIEIWGYRNVWYRYQPFEADQFIPVSLMSMAVMQQTFLKSFLSQAEASFPSHDHDGPFSELAQRVQVEQYQQLLNLLGQEFFYQNSDSRIRSTRGMILLKKMSTEEFYTHSYEIERHTE